MAENCHSCLSKLDLICEIAVPFQVSAGLPFKREKIEFLDPCSPQFYGVLFLSYQWSKLGLAGPRGVTTIYQGTGCAIFWGAFFRAENKLWGIIFGKVTSSHKFWGVILEK